ncbi:MAG: FAD-dependent oxidoreductase [Desulfotomaculales bacterium]
MQQERRPVGAAMVVGGGVSGIQAALDLADAGFKVYLVERQPAIGGRMAQLDKTFPTNDCSMCTLAPRLVECGRHPNITILTCAEVREISGVAGDFSVRVRQYARLVDPDKCRGCGECESVCPVEVEDEFNEGLSKRKAIYRPYPQAVPNIYAIDIRRCLECVECEEACTAGAVNPFMGDREFRLRVGAIILAPGYELFDASARPEFGYGVFPNVVTALEFERLLSASGPYQGHFARPSDGAVPKKIAFIQCAGSRDAARGLPYCSAVCCMYATKQALLVKEHVPDADIAVFYIDMRAFGKDFERYYERARREGVRYIRCMVSQVAGVPGGDELVIRYRTEDGNFREEQFDMVVLSVGLRPPAAFAELARVAGIERNEYGFCKTWEFYPNLTSRPGVFAAGVIVAPKDIPETVVDASAAAANASRLLQAARGSLTTTVTYPPEKQVANEAPRVGVFVCNCGVNIGGVVDVPDVVRYAAGLPGVVHSREFLFACSQDSIAAITKAIEEHNLNRVVVAACTPRTHAPLFQSSLRAAGLNPYLYEHVNIREQCSWVHQHDKAQATSKAKDLVRMAVTKARLLSPVITTFLDIEPLVLVVGGGAAGMTAALSVADQGFPVCLVEKEPVLGGNLRHLYYTLEGSDPQALLYDLTVRVEHHPLIRVMTGAEILGVEGYTGNFTTRIRQGDLEREVKHGAVILATGAVESRPKEYLYGRHPRVVTQTEFERMLAAGRAAGLANVVMIQCVGSREEGRPYCSRVCCGHAVKNALKLKELNPDANVFVLYRDVRTYGFNEKYYREARERGVLFVRYEPQGKPAVEADGERLLVRVTDPVLNTGLEIGADLVVLSAAIEPRPDTERLAHLYKVPLTPDGFFAEAHMKLRPVDFATEGMYLAGLGHAPKTLSESLAQAQAAAVRAVGLLGRGRLESTGVTVRVDAQRCSGCGICLEVCPYGARYMDEQKVARVIEALCRGCGACVATCPSGATQQWTFEDGQIIHMIEAALLG